MENRPPPNIRPAAAAGADRVAAAVVVVGFAVAGSFTIRSRAGERNLVLDDL